MERLHLKTETEILRDFYTFIKNSAIGQTLQGDVYQWEQRPDNATTEDAVIFHDGIMDYLLQTGVIVCNIYIPDILTKNGETTYDKERVQALQTAIHTFIDDFTCEDYYQIRTEETPELQKVEGINQHRIYARFRFYRRAS